jgi:hypothetical protein
LYKFAVVIKYDFLNRIDFFKFSAIQNILSKHLLFNVILCYFLIDVNLR